MTSHQGTPQTKALGFRLLPRPPEHVLGYGGLLVTMRPHPTHLHFDPELMRLRLSRPDGGVEWASLGRESTVPQPARLCPGRLFLLDRREQRIDFFSFGGGVEPFYQPGQTVYRIDSSAPILALTRLGQTNSDQLTAEVEMRLAMFRARWLRDQPGFARCLAQVDPGQFYRACLGSILARYERVPTLRRLRHAFYLVLRQEQARLKAAGQWPATWPRLEELLGCP